MRPNFLIGLALFLAAVVGVILVTNASNVSGARICAPDEWPGGGQPETDEKGEYRFLGSRSASSIRVRRDGFVLAEIVKQGRLIDRTLRLQHSRTVHFDFGSGQRVRSIVCGEQGIKFYGHHASETDYVLAGIPQHAMPLEVRIGDEKHMMLLPAGVTNWSLLK